MKQQLSILIPIYNEDCRLMVGELNQQAASIDGLSYEIVVADDGSTERSLVDVCLEIGSWPNCRFIDRRRNVGRAAIRNFLARKASYPWLLFIDGDMSIVRDDFLRRHLDTDHAMIAYGGYVPGPGQKGNLRYRYETRCAPQHSVEQRRKHPFQHFHTCNFTVSRDILLAHPFDERFRHYGYEDVLWGKQLQKAGLVVEHLDNPVGFCTYEDNASFVAKTEEGLRTLNAFQGDLRGYSQMIAIADRIRSVWARLPIRLWHRLFGSAERRNLCGSRPCLSVFRLYKLGYFMTITSNNNR